MNNWEKVCAYQGPGIFGAVLLIEFFLSQRDIGWRDMVRRYSLVGKTQLGPIQVGGDASWEGYRLGWLLVGRGIC